MSARFFSSWQIVLLVIVMPFVAFGSYYGAAVHVKAGTLDLSIDRYADLIQRDNKINGTAQSFVPGLSGEQIRDKLKGASRNLPIATVLWLDDNPNNNIDQRQALGLLGIFCDSYSKTLDAESAARSVHYDMVISNGWDYTAQSLEPKIQFLQDIRNIQATKATPFLFYSHVHAYDPEIQEASERFNATSTSYTADVLTWVVNNIPSSK
jgi:hypothetical protein